MTIMLRVSHSHWLILGLILMALELVVPGGIVAAIGFSALLIGLFIWLGWVSSFLSAVVIWTIVTILALLALRPILKKFYPSETSKGNFNEDVDLYGTEVNVIDTIEAGAQGRILVRGTSWAAKLTDSKLVAATGTQVRLVVRNNITWYVEPVTKPVNKGTTL